MLATRPLPASFGVEVSLDLGRPLGAEAAPELRALMTAHGLLLFRGQDLTADQHRGAVACFGRIACGDDGQPKEMYVSNRRRSDAPDGALIFHYDYAYDRNPTEFIGLYGQEIDDGATPTLFASSAAVLNALPAGLKQRIGGLDALHACFLDRTAPDEIRIAMEDDAILRGAPGWSAKDWKCSHPLVWSNRQGVPSLFACIQHTVRILGLPIAESDALLETLFGYLYAPCNVYEHSWRVGDLVIWDNRTVQHCRPTPTDGARTLRRFEVLDEDINDAYLAIGRANKFL
jgi:taurine dioxygenase